MPLPVLDLIFQLEYVGYVGRFLRTCKSAGAFFAFFPQTVFAELPLSFLYLIGTQTGRLVRGKHMKHIFPTLVVIGQSDSSFYRVSIQYMGAKGVLKSSYALLYPVFLRKMRVCSSLTHYNKKAAP